VGLTEDDAKARGVKVKKGPVPVDGLGPRIANGRDEGFPSCCSTRRAAIVGGIVGTHAAT
jgi:dihydrolipoamide dehydrogenase